MKQEKISLQYFVQKTISFRRFKNRDSLLKSAGLEIDDPMEVNMFLKMVTMEIFSFMEGEYHHNYSGLSKIRPMLLNAII